MGRWIVPGSLHRATTPYEQKRERANRGYEEGSGGPRDRLGVNYAGDNPLRLACYFFPGVSHSPVAQDTCTD